MSSLRSITLATLTKDIRLEWRSRDAINSMLFFSLLVVVIFSFSFDPNAEESREIAGGLIWVAFLFAAVVALNQTWARELRNQVLDAYRVSPAPANALFVAKALGNFILVSVLEAVMAPLFMIFYNLRVLGPSWQLIPVAILGTWALVVNGTFLRPCHCAPAAAKSCCRSCCSPSQFQPCSRWWRLHASSSPVTAQRDSGSYCFSPMMWCLLLLVWLCSEPFCRQNETGLPHPRSSYSTAAGLRFL
jgi:ABC-type transport system involved in cytochrome c biogenesis permease component